MQPFQHIQPRQSYVSVPRRLRFTETIRPGAFRASLLRPNSDVLALRDHDLGRVLGRTRSGTLKLHEAADGLRYELSLPDTSDAHDLLALAERGDIGGVSIGFVPTDEAWPSRDQREIRSADLHEISFIAAHPAYSTTSVEPRSRPAGISDAARGRSRFLARI